MTDFQYIPSGGSRALPLTLTPALFYWDRTIVSTTTTTCLNTIYPSRSFVSMIECCVFVAVFLFDLFLTARQGGTRSISTNAPLPLDLRRGLTRSLLARCWQWSRDVIGVCGSIRYLASHLNRRLFQHCGSRRKLCKSRERWERSALYINHFGEGHFSGTTVFSHG